MPKTSELESVQRIGRYVDCQMLGRGGMGAVYRARDPELDRPVAIKVMLEATEDFVARFRREAQAIARLTHANIVQVYDFGVDESGNPYFVMELIDGTPLDQPGARAGAALAVGGDPPHPSGGRRTVLRASRRDRASRHQAVEPDRRRARRGQVGRLRHRARDRHQRTAHGRLGADGHARLHGAGAGAGKAGRSPRRRVRARPHHVRAFGGPAAVQRRRRHLARW